MRLFTLFYILCRHFVATFLESNLVKWVVDNGIFKVIRREVSVAHGHANFGMAKDVF